jgi:very-short-patch-repair endonuclease
MPRRPDTERRQERQDAFLAAFAETGIASRAAATAGIPGPQHYAWLKNDPQYAERFAELRSQTRDLAGQNAGTPGPKPGTRQGGARGQARKRRQDAFIEAIGRGLPVMAAARATGMGAPTAHYQWMSDDPAYAERFREAFDRTSDIRKSLVSQTLSDAAARSWSKPARHEQHGEGQRRRRITESGALERAHLQGSFLAIILDGIPLAAAVRAAGITKTIHRQWLETSPGYATAFERAYGDSAGRREEYISDMRTRASAARWGKADARERNLEWNRQYWTPERREEWSQRMCEVYQDPALREHLLAAAREWWDRPGSRDVNRERMNKVWADPEYRAKHAAAMAKPVTRERLSAAAKAQWESYSPEEQEARLKHMRRAFKGGHKLTAIESEVMLALNDRDVPYVVHKQIGRYVADILVPSLHLVIECDGAWFHDRRQGTDADRDEELRSLGFETLRLAEAEIKAKDWTRLDAEIIRLSR